MATQNFLHGLPSPTLTNPDLILPDDDRGSYSPAPDHSLPPEIYVRQHDTIKLADAPPGRRTSTPRTMTPTSSIHSSHPTPTTLDQDSAHFQHNRSVDTVDAAHSIRSHSSQNTPNAWRANRDVSRSNSSTSGRSRNSQKMSAQAPIAETALYEGDKLQPHSRNAQTEEHAIPYSASDSRIEEEEEDDKAAALPKLHARDDDEEENEKWLDDQDDAETEMSSHAALSKRAEMILANAKKRLNVG